jgi:2-hydroxy-6-oxonona-2,4-dienedioate hydrolase
MLRPALFGGFAAVLLTAAVPVYAAYRADIGAARARVGSGSAIAHTRCGPIEYADVGRGPVVLSIHGTGGGFDQGLLLARQLAIDPAEYRIVAPSRYGYLRTPMPAGDTSPAAEADAHACLLDTLGISEPAIVVGGSAGALSATQFAIRYPGRVSRLVLTVPANWAPPAPGDTSAHEVGGSGFIFNVVLRSDFLMWAFIRLAGDDMASFIGVPKELQRDLSSDDRATIEETLSSILPVSQRYQGILKEAANHAARTRDPLERVQAPTLVVDAMDMDTFRGAKYTAEHVPNATLVAYETGGHLLLGHQQHTRDAVREFLRQK